MTPYLLVVVNILLMGLGVYTGNWFMALFNGGCAIAVIWAES
jgi:hypothetical protein